MSCIPFVWRETLVHRYIHYTMTALPSALNASTSMRLVNVTYNGHITPRAANMRESNWHLSNYALNRLLIRGKWWKLTRRDKKKKKKERVRLDFAYGLIIEYLFFLQLILLQTIIARRFRENKMEPSLYCLFRKLSRDNFSGVIPPRISGKLAICGRGFFFI